MGEQEKPAAKPAARKSAAPAARRPADTPSRGANGAIMNRFEPVREYFIRLAGEERYLKEASFAAQIIAGNGGLQATSIESQTLAFQALAESGLTLNPVLKLAYFVPRNGRCQLEPSYMGLAKLLTDTGSVRHIEVHVVYQGDECEVDMASERKVLRHVPYAMRGVQKGEIRAFYSLATLADGSKHMEFMSKDEVDAIMARSESYKAYKAGKIRSTTWTTDYEEMGRKTVLKRHAKHLPKSNRWELLGKAIDMDNSDFDMDSGYRGQLASGISSEAAQEAEAIKEEVRHAIRDYAGADKEAIKAECAAFSKSGRIDPEFWRGVLNRLTAGQPEQA